MNRTEPLDHDDYLKQRDALGLSYKESIREYDRLVTWLSAGALGLSITFPEKFGQGADSGTRWLLGAGWTALALAFGSSLWSQYCSSRLHSWKLRELRHLQLPAADRSKTWANEAVRLDAVAGRYGTATKWPTFVSGVLVGRRNHVRCSLRVPQCSFQAPAQAPRTAVVQVPEKIGIPPRAGAQAEGVATAAKEALEPSGPTYNCDGRQLVPAESARAGRSPGGCGRPPRGVAPWLTLLTRLLSQGPYYLVS